MMSAQGTVRDALFLWQSMACGLVPSGEDRRPEPEPDMRVIAGGVRFDCVFNQQKKSVSPHVAMRAFTFGLLLWSGLALTGFEPTLRLVDYIDAALTAHDAAIAMTLLERAEGVTYLHWVVSFLSRRADCALG